MAEAQKHKLYAYVDESGQDTEGALFLVSVIIIGSERDRLRRRLSEAEHVSGKKARKWMKARPQQRVAYMHYVLNMSELAGHLYYSYYQHTRSYIDLTIFSTAKAIHDAAPDRYQATIFVDGLGRPERHRFSAGLRKLKVRVTKVRGVKDESEEFIRLADAIAGFVRDALQQDQNVQRLFQEAKRNGLLKEV